MNLKEADQLLERYLAGQCSAEEKARVERWIDGYRNKKNAWADADAGTRERRIAQMREQLAADILQRREEPVRQGLRKIPWRGIAAAFLLLAIPAAVYFLLQREPDRPQIAAKPGAAYQNDLAPGSDKAVLTLSDGSRILLHDTTAGEVASQGSTRISLAEGGRIVYSAPGASGMQHISYNTITTPRGGQFQVVLPDNTKVWLNAVSSIRFPTVFSGPERRVEITGEAYFEVQEDKTHPFIVTSGEQEVEVLGTHFNINAYPDEAAIKTTLLNGSVKVTSGEKSVLLKPGQQSLAEPGRSSFTIRNVETGTAVAWKNGFFQIENADIQTIMRQVARWYDVEIVYDEGLPDKRFSGKIRRNVNASQLLDMLSYFGVKFRIEGKEIIVTK